MPDDDLLAALQGLSYQALVKEVADLPLVAVTALLADLGGATGSLPASPIAQAIELDPGYVPRAHLRHLSARLEAAIADVQQGSSRRIVVSMPPRMGKSQMTSVYLPLWLLRRNPAWKIGLLSHDPSLATAWGRTVRGLIEAHPEFGLSLARDAGAASEWQVTGGGGVLSRSAPGQSITGRGFNILIVDDVVRDFAAAHSETTRKALWEWWTANAETRLEPPSLVLVIGTRWHEDDLIGRLLSDEYEGDPADWEVISFPAIAEEGDALGRLPGDPLLSPLVRQETPGQALTRWEAIKRSVGSYAWAALFQQRPAPATGAIFDTGWWRYWTTDPERATDDGRVRYIDPDALLGARWIDSWDAAFKDTDSSDYVVGQRWCLHGANRYLIGQTRGRWAFPATLARMGDWADGGPYPGHVFERLIEDKANGPAIISVLREKVAGIKPVNPTTSKEARARAITPEVESGNVYLPLPAEHPWVLDLLAELRSFPSGAHDDQVDALTQALTALRENRRAQISVPGQRSAPVVRNLAAAARTGPRRGPGG